MISCRSGLFSLLKVHMPLLLNNHTKVSPLQDKAGPLRKYPYLPTGRQTANDKVLRDRELLGLWREER